MTFASTFLIGVGGFVTLGFAYSILYLSYQYASSYRGRGRHPELELRGKHVLVTGGSSGIGKEVAKKFANLGANVSILARSRSKLSAAAEEIRSSTSVRVADVSVDLSSDFDTVDKAVKEATARLGAPVFVLVNCAGFSVSKRFENLTASDDRKMMDVNYFGSVNATRSVLPEMKAAGGVIVYVASQASLIGVYGYTTYSGSKFAIRGFAEALAMELAPFNIRVTVNCPPDTDTPGYEAENVGKPEETSQISSYSGLFKPEQVAESILDDVLRGRFLGTTGTDGWVSVLLAGGTVNCSILQVLMEAFTLGPARLLCWLYVRKFYSIVIACHKKRNVSKKRE